MEGGGWQFRARTWMIDLKGRGIRVNVLSPGARRTPVMLGCPVSIQSRAPERLLAWLTAHILLRRAPNADEVVAAALFLISADASFVSGIELFGDGRTARM
jgi:NAD(P)-dependent dehydrogenase (short-subunit alcohol dehydrogenase family)